MSTKNLTRLLLPLLIAALLLTPAAAKYAKSLYAGTIPLTISPAPGNSAQSTTNAAQNAAQAAAQDTAQSTAQAAAAAPNAAQDTAQNATAAATNAAQPAHNAAATNAATQADTDVTAQAAAPNAAQNTAQNATDAAATQDSAQGAAQAADVAATQANTAAAATNTADAATPATAQGAAQAAAEAAADAMRRALRALAALICLALMAFGLRRLLALTHERGEARASYEALDIYVEPLPSPSAPAEADPEASPGASSPYQVNFDALAAVNPDVAAWLVCEGTALSYPVVQGEDNEYYLSRLFDGSPNASGCLFLDSRCAADFSSLNSVIYGHHMKDGTMFAALDGYKSQDFYEAHPSLLLLTPDGCCEAEVFSAYVAPTDASSWRLDFADEPEFTAWLAALRAASCIDTAITPAPTDRVLTLSTCSYEFEDARLVVHCVLRGV